MIEWFSIVCQKLSGNYFGFGFTIIMVSDWLSSLISK